MGAAVSIELGHLVQLRAEAHGFSLRSRQHAGSLLAGRHVSRLRGRGLAFEELRRYVPGDDVRAIDWRATARLRSTQVRIYSEERERPVLLLIDQRAAMFFGSQRAMKSVAAAEVAALAAWHALGAGDRVGGIVFGDVEIVELAPHRSRNRVLRLLHEIARFNHALADASADGAPGQLDRVLEAALAHRAHDQLVLLVSDLDGAGARTGQLATRLAAHNDVVVVPVYDPLGATLRARPGMIAASGAERFELPTGPAFEDAFREIFGRLAAEWTQLFRALRVPLLPVSAAAPVAGQLRRQLGERGP
jgi:uncharacterized protein (DUF58 family)